MQAALHLHALIAKILLALSYSRKAPMGKLSWRAGRTAAGCYQMKTIQTLDRAWVAKLLILLPNVVYLLVRTQTF